jgi:hypothetical protein
MSLPSDPTSGTQMQTGSPADGFVDLRMSSGRMMAVSLGLLTRGTVERKVSSKEKASSSPAPVRHAGAIVSGAGSGRRPQRRRLITDR